MVSSHKINLGLASLQLWLALSHKISIHKPRVSSLTKVRARIRIRIKVKIKIGLKLGLELNLDLDLELGLGLE